jgi:hypothetical protein
MLLVDYGDFLGIVLAVAQRGQGIRRFPALRYEQRKSAIFQNRIAIPELAGEIEINRDARKFLKPVFCDHPGIIACAAGDNGDAVDCR